MVGCWCMLIGGTGLGLLLSSYVNRGVKLCAACMSVLHALRCVLADERVLAGCADVLKCLGLSATLFHHHLIVFSEFGGVNMNIHGTRMWCKERQRCPHICSVTRRTAQHVDTQRTTCLALLLMSEAAQWLQAHVKLSAGRQDAGGSCASIIITARQNLLSHGVQVEGVLILGNIRAPDIAQRRVGVHNSCVAQILQSHLVLGLAQPVQEPAQPPTLQCAAHAQGLFSM